MSCIMMLLMGEYFLYNLRITNQKRTFKCRTKRHTAYRYGCKVARHHIAIGVYRTRASDYVIRWPARTFETAFR